VAKVRKLHEIRIIPLGEAVEQIGDSWMLMILWASYEGVTRFDDYQKRLGVARNILSNRLRRLCELDILEKRPVREGARRLEYRVTPKGEELRGPLTDMHRWGARWSGAAEGARAALPVPTAAE
jgi:DNA-binding HxlR family transcriptional regulator